jgi:hypothetical protein
MRDSSFTVFGESRMDIIFSLVGGMLMIFVLSGAFLTHVFCGDPFHVRVRPLVPLLFGMNPFFSSHMYFSYADRVILLQRRCSSLLG